MPWDADPALENLDIGKAYSQCGINDPASFSVMRKIGMTASMIQGPVHVPEQGSRQVHIHA